MTAKLKISFTLLFICCGIIANAQLVPQTITYVGWLSDASSQQNPIDGPVAMEFSIYDESSNGNLFWNEVWDTVNVDKGKVSLILGTNGSPIPSSVFSEGTDRYLQIKINGYIQSPRQKIASAGYAYKSKEATDSDQLGGIPASSWQRAISPQVCPVSQYFYGFAQNGTAYCDIPLNNYLPGIGLFLIGGNTFNVQYGATSGTVVEGNDPRLNDWIISGDNLYAGVTGNLGIGTNNPSAKLEVAGNIRIADGTEGPGKVLVSDQNGEASWASFGSVPAGSIAFFNLANCPPGWSEFIEARGRYVVGLTPGGVPGTTVGTALTDLENRSTGKHTHTITDPGHAHTLYNAALSSGSILCGGGGQYGPIPTMSVSPGVTVLGNQSPAGTNAPYVQFLICKKD